MSIHYASMAGLKGRRADGTMVYGIIPQGDGSAYQWLNCGACAEASRVVSQTKNRRPSAGSPWPPTGASIRRETGDTSGGLNPYQTTQASTREYGVSHAAPRIASKQIILDKLREGYAIDLLVAYGPIDDYMSGSPGFRGNHRMLLTGRNTDTRKLRSNDSLYDGRRAGIPEGARWIPQSVMFDAASRLDLGGGTRLSSKYGYDDAYFIPSLTRLDQQRYEAHIPKGKYGQYYLPNGVILHRTMYSTGGFSGQCTAPQLFPVHEDANVPGGYFKLVRMLTGSRGDSSLGAGKGKWINASWAKQV